MSQATPFPALFVIESGIEYPEMKRDKSPEGEEKQDLSRSQLYLIGASIVVILVLAFALVRLLKKEPQPEQQAATQQAPVEPLAKAPQPAGNEEIKKLEQELPKQAQPEKVEQPRPAVPPAPASKAQATPPQAVAPQAATVHETTPVKTSKPKVKSAKAVHRTKAKPLHKQVDVKAKKSKVVAEHHAAPAQKPEPQKLSKKPDEGSFVSEAVQTPPVPFVDVTPAVETKPEPKPEAPKHVKPEFTVYVKTFKGQADAKEYAQELLKKGYKPFLVKKETTKSTWFYVMAGEFANREAAQKFADDLAKHEGLPTAVQPYPQEGIVTSSQPYP
jgi:cell division septation protein DedD